MWCGCSRSDSSLVHILPSLANVQSPTERYLPKCSKPSVKQPMCKKAPHFLPLLPARRTWWRPPSMILRPPPNLRIEATMPDSAPIGCDVLPRPADALLRPQRQPLRADVLRAVRHRPRAHEVLSRGGTAWEPPLAVLPRIGRHFREA